MAHMDLDHATTRTLTIHGMAWIVAGLLFVLGSWLIGQGAWIHIKAVTAQWLLQEAWEEMLHTHQPVKPWPWADTWPAGQLAVPRLHINQIILANASGQSLAFGPGMVGNGNVVRTDTESLIVSGHRDTHFSFVRDLQPQDTINVQTIHGKWHTFIIEKTRIIDSRRESLSIDDRHPTLQLVTCYSFDALVPGGPLRYVVTATLRTTGTTNMHQRKSGLHTNFFRRIRALCVLLGCGSRFMHHRFNMLKAGGQGKVEGSAFIDR